jgi:transposase
LFVPTYTSELNPIERLWSIVKRKWTQNLHLFVDEMSEALTKKVNKKQELLTRNTIARLRETIGIVKIINFFIASVNNQTVIQVARSHYKPMLSVL